MEVVIYKDKGKLIYENLNEMNNYLILIILLFCITGCKEKRPAIKEAVFEFNPNNILVCDTLDINQICDSFRYIPLETRDSVLIEEVTDVRPPQHLQGCSIGRTKIPHIGNKAHLRGQHCAHCPAVCQKFFLGEFRSRHQKQVFDPAGSQLTRQFHRLFQRFDAGWLARLRQGYRICS